MPLDLPTAPDAGTAARPRSTPRPGWLLGLAAALGVAVVLSLAVGSNPLSPAEVLAALGDGGTAETRYVVRDLRVPRTIVGIVVGIALGVAGALMQALTRNPLADPGILGVNAGAAFCVALGVSLLGIQSIAGYVWLAFAGALVVTVAVYVIGSTGRGAADPVRLTLAGVALGAVLSGLTTGLSLSDPTAFDRMRSWNAGTVLGRGLDVLAPVLPFAGLGLLLALVVAGGLNSVALGEDLARSHGVDVRRTRLLVVCAVTLLAGSATAVAGPISFIGLMVPHVVRWTLGPDQRTILAGTVLLAPTLLLVADVLGRLLVLPGEMPVGVVTAFVGAPLLIVLVRRRKAAAL
ncbi:FecCD family ABC transporter permease [Nocardioides carbamazepini]|uniref:FecCD family ABC transporter permease n=1 Tax=Nocardioides carbamazepini TaxID=2854259 RepID=UPI00214A385A|nr:iron chelate uptake ABC transporter family permease subunit [Nocardioides carbamazepini]